MDKLEKIAIRRMLTPSLYIQGKGAIYYLGQKAFAFGDKAYVIGGPTALNVAGERIKKSLVSNGIEVVGWNDSVRECTHKTIEKLAESGKQMKAHFVVGVGGGRAIDTAKAVAWKMKLPVISVGTQCATNADGSSESVIYTEDHKFVEDLYLPRNPVAVIEDTEIIAKAPVKYLIWGMGDAVSCRFEGEAYAKARLKKKDGAVPTSAALALGDACYKSLLANGLKAVTDLKNGIHSHEVDEVIEAVKLSSAMAFENTGCALAHALHNGLTKTGQVKGEHGEIVAYATIVQGVYEKRPRDELQQLSQWCEKVGLPTKLKLIGDPSKAALRMAVEYAAEKDHNIKNMPDKVKPSELLEVMDRVERGQF
ncbi:MAG: glycerol dehydrogenase [Thermoplasmata archaeon]|jgi:glycerol dehydrogenase|nr:glycerol dehydrogenase [Thermoplasmata archaeon]